MTRIESANQAEKVIALRKQGLLCREIAARLGCSQYRVWYVLQTRGHAIPMDRPTRLLAEIFGDRA